MSKEMTKNKLVQALNTVGTTLDTNLTCNFMGEFGCADVFGTKYYGSTSVDLLDNLKALGVDVNGVHYKEPFWFIGDTPVVELVKEVVTEDKPVELVEPEKVVEESTSPDWEWISTLNNNKKDKNTLDVYAEKFDVRLNQRNTLKNMVSDFKSKLSN